MKHKAKPLEFSFAADAFNLEIQTTSDGEREQRESDQAASDRRDSDRRQTQIIHDIHRPHKS